MHVNYRAQKDVTAKLQLKLALQSIVDLHFFQDLEAQNAKNI